MLPLHFENLVFDLDGTLVDSLPGIEASLRTVLMARHPSRTLSPGALRPLVGPPLAQIIATLWPDFAPEEVAALVTAYRAHYLVEGCIQTKPFPGVMALLEEFYHGGVKLFVLTNKPRAQTEILLNHQGWTRYFREVSCLDDPHHPFVDKTVGAIGLRERQGLLPPKTLLVGDAVEDACAAAAAGWEFAGAGYGYGLVTGHGSSFDEVKTMIGTFAELRPLIFAPASSSPTHDHPQSLR